MQQVKDQQISPRQRNCLLHECFFWLYHAAVIGLGLAILAKIVLSFDILQQIQSSPQIIHAQQTTYLWQKSPIIDIKSVNTNNCPQGYNPLLTYNWTGTTNGCYCQAVVQNRGLEYVLNGLCTSQLISEGCQQISAMTQQTLNMWKGGKLICVKREQGVSFYDSVELTTSGGIELTTCATNKTYQFNTLPNVSCPITQTSNTTLPSSTIISLSSTQNLYYTTQSNYPIADFKVSEYAFCEFLNQINISPNKIGNYILQISQYQTCPGVDPRYQQFDQLNEEDFYTNNTRVYNMIQQLPGYPRPSTNYVFKLGYIRYPQWTYQCRTSQNYNLNIATQHLLFTNQKQSIQNLVYVSMPCIIVFAILFRVFFSIRHILQLRQRMLYNAVFLTDNEIEQQLPNLNIKHSKVRQSIIFLIEEMLKIAVIVVVIIALLKMFSTSVWIKDIIKINCTQDFIYQLFLYYEQKIDAISEILVEICFIWAVMFIIDIIWLIMRFKYIDLSYASSRIIEESSMNPSQEQLDHINQKQKLKQLELPQQSSQVIIEKDRSIVKISDIDDLDDRIFGASETKGNFYNISDLQNSDYNLVMSGNKKKKKKQVIKKKKNLFKGSDDA